MTERAKRTRQPTKAGCDEPSGTSQGRRPPAARADDGVTEPDLDQRERRQKPHRKAAGPKRERRVGGRRLTETAMPATDPVEPTDPE